MFARRVRNRSRFSWLINTPARFHAAIARSVDRNRYGFPPGGLRGPPSTSHKASRISSIDTGFLIPAGERREGQDAIADASDAHEARTARFSAVVRAGCVATSFGCSKTVPG